MRGASRRGCPALTDHDDTGGLAEAREAHSGAGITFVNGVEISVTWGGHTVHVVGLHIDPAHPALAGGLAIICGRGEAPRRDHRAGARQGRHRGSLAGARSHVTNPELVGRTHFARFLAERGYARDVSSVFRRYLAPGKPGYVPHRWASLGDAIDWIKRAAVMRCWPIRAATPLDGVQRD